MTPAETARNEAAKQAVMLVFGIAAALLMLPLYKRLAEQQAEAMASQAHLISERADPVMERIRRAQAALETAKRWDRIAGMLFVLGPQRAFWWAHDQAEKARAIYRAEQP